MTKRNTPPTSRRALLASGAAALAASTLPLTAPQAAETIPVVVELFTSQGCSSCPPAEALLAELAERPEIIALSYHVQYWDHIGWKDTFGDPRCQERQEAYRAWLGTHFLYTPQMVIAGRHDVVGSRRREVVETIRSASTLALLPLAIEESANGPALSLPAGAVGPKGAQLLAVRYLTSAVTRVERGENAGRTLRERNIVRDIQHVTLWDGEARLIPLPPGQDATHGQAFLLQDLASGAILGAAERRPLVA
ncbi:MAG: DUF1223 domain-containing protein [Pseudomonadota bacterium]